MPVLTRLTSSQWQLLLRAHDRGGRIADVDYWLHVSDAGLDDLLELEQGRYLIVVQGHDRVEPPRTRSDLLAGGYRALLAAAGEQAARQLVEQHKVLSYLDNLSSTWTPIRDLGQSAERWEALVALNSADLIAAHRLGSEHEIDLASLHTTRSRQGVVVKIRAKGKPYARRRDV